MAADKNLTGEQIQHIMDMLLYKALEPIVVYTDAFDAQVDYLLVLISTNRKRKLSSLEREDVVCKLAAYLANPDRKKKYEYIRAARIERHFSHAFIRNFVEANAWFLEAYRDFMLSPSAEARKRLNDHARAVGNCNRAQLYKAINIATSYIARFYDYRGTVVGHYVKNSSKLAKAHTSMSSNKSSFADLRQSILRSLITALDKYDSRKGALTSYINTWAKNATTTTREHEYGIAYTIPQAQRKKLYDGGATESNFSVSLDALYSESD